MRYVNIIVHVRVQRLRLRVAGIVVDGFGRGRFSDQGMKFDLSHRHFSDLVRGVDSELSLIFFNPVVGVGSGSWSIFNSAAGDNSESLSFFEFSRRDRL